eukprot:c25410_g1_i1.p1 GENE.c25410_g1_i1~~c25410_g1_i1.p1  ORF type:complete len:120 (+),score=22.86 c25410_g1_i1:282-641(+)
MSGEKSCPVLNLKEIEYKDWLQRIKIWYSSTTVPVECRAATIVGKMEGDPFNLCKDMDLELMNDATELRADNENEKKLIEEIDFKGVKKVTVGMYNVMKALEKGYFVTDKMKIDITNLK